MADLRNDADRDLDRNDTKPDGDLNPDPLTGAPGSHPVGTGIGAAGAGAAGAAIGAVGGPIGALAGAAIGAVVGGLAGKGVAEAIDPTVEESYWRENYHTRPYIEHGAAYGEYEPAYRYGWESRRVHSGRRWEDVEHDLAHGWDRARGQSRLEWEKAKLATKDAWHRVETRVPGDADRDGR